MDMNLAKSALTERFTEFAPLSTAAADYDVVRRAIAHIRGNWRSQPEIDVIANAAGVSATDLHHLFRRWCGLTPKAFLQALTLNSARELLRSSASILDTAYEVGLSGPGRLHDLFVTHEAMSPGEWKAGGEGLTITYGFHPCPFGMALVMTTPRGLAGLALADAGKERAALKDMRGRWPRARYVEDFAATAATARRIFDPALVAQKPAIARRPDRHGFRSPCLGKAARYSDGRSHNLFGSRCQRGFAKGGACRRRGCREESDLFS
jgi:AraC family transcriptional regulator of adaptative response/methylated-DNA-[protein]-cysteine methyltransferase